MFFFSCEIRIISLASLGVGDKVVKDIRPGVPFEPTYIYKLLTLIKSSLSEKVNSLITALMGLVDVIRCLDIFKMFVLVSFSSFSLDDETEVWQKLPKVWIYRTHIQK